MKIGELAAFLYSPQTGATLKPRQIENLVRMPDGMPRTKVGRTWDYGPDAVTWYYTKGPGAPVQPVGVEAARARKENAQAEMAEYQLAQLQGQMITVEDAQVERNRSYDSIRAKLLNFPGWMAPRLAGRKMGEVQQALEDGVNEILTVLSTEDDADTALEPGRPKKRPPKARKRKKKAAGPKATP